MLKKIISSFFLFYPTFSLGQSYVVYDFTHNKVLESHQAHQVRPIASVTKLMTALVFLENNHNKHCMASIMNMDRDNIKGTNTRLPKNQPIACNELLKAMLVHSDNYAAHALARSSGMTRAQFIQQMNNKAKSLGMNATRFVDSSGLSSGNISNVMDLVKLSHYAMQKPIIQSLSNTKETFINTGERQVAMRNTNVLVRGDQFEASLNKTGYTREAGYNLVFVNKYRCNNRAIIGVISLNNRTAGARSNFTRNKLLQYGCQTVS